MLIVLVLASTLANLIKNRKKLDMQVIIISSPLHDCDRKNDGKDPYHAKNSMKKALRFVDENKIDCNKKLIKECLKSLSNR